MEARKAGIAHGWMWLKQGYWLFRRNPFLWMVLSAALFVGMAGIAMFPVVGLPLAIILFPAFFAGLMQGCHALAGEQELKPMHLFAAFQKHAGPLATLGGIWLAGLLLVIGAIIWSGGAPLLDVLGSSKPPEDPEVVAQALRDSGFAFPLGLLGLLLISVLGPCVLLASMLVVFREVAALPALLAALRALLRNALPYLAYSLMQLPFAYLASLPWMLGWLVLLPVFITSQYAMYRDMFPMPGDHAE